jgi:hypothetical protein
LVEFEIAVPETLAISRSSGQSDDKRLKIEMLDLTKPRAFQIQGRGAETGDKTDY